MTSIHVNGNLRMVRDEGDLEAARAGRGGPADMPPVGDRYKLGYSLLGLARTALGENEFQRIYDRGYKLSPDEAMRVRSGAPSY